MRLRVHVIVGKPARFYEAGSEIDDALVPQILHRYRCDDEEADQLLAEAKARREKRSSARRNRRAIARKLQGSF
jgi:hypothetical protein